MASSMPVVLVECVYGKKWLGCGYVCVLTVDVRTFVSYVNGLIDNCICLCICV